MKRPEDEKCYGCKWAEWYDDELCECTKEGRFTMQGCWEPEPSCMECKHCIPSNKPNAYICDGEQKPNKLCQETK